MYIRMVILAGPALGREPSRRKEVEELDLTTIASERRLDEADMS